MLSFLHQIVEHGGFYRSSGHTWVAIERIQFLGACNPPTDPGRKPLSHRYGWALIRNVSYGSAPVHVLIVFLVVYTCTCVCE